MTKEKPEKNLAPIWKLKSIKFNILSQNTKFILMKISK